MSDDKSDKSNNKLKRLTRELIKLKMEKETAIGI
jgi:hypothetical protein